MTPLPTLTAATDDGPMVGASFGPGSREPSPDGLGPSGFDPSRISWLVEQIESAQKCSDFNRTRMNGYRTNSPEYLMAAWLADTDDNFADRRRAELRAIIGVDAWRLANAIGA